MKKKNKILLALFCAFALIGCFNSINVKANYSGYINLEDESSELMTLNELIVEYSQNTQISVFEAQNEIYESLNFHNLTEEEIIEINQSMYKTISDTLNVSSTYKPQINFYCKVWQSAYFGEIEEILNVNLNRVYNNLSYKYSGTIYVNLEDMNTIYYTMDGDWYENGTTSYNGQANIGISEFVTLNFGLSYASDHYKAFYVSTRKYWGERWTG